MRDHGTFLSFRFQCDRPHPEWQVLRPGQEFFSLPCWTYTYSWSLLEYDAMNRPRCRMGTTLRLTQNLWVQDVAWHQADLPRATYYTRDTRILDWRNTWFSVSPNSKFCIVWIPSVLLCLDSICSVLPGLHLLCVAWTPSALCCRDSICPVLSGLHLSCITWTPSPLYCLDSICSVLPGLQSWW